MVGIHDDDFRLDQRDRRQDGEIGSDNWTSPRLAGGSDGSLQALNPHPVGVMGTHHNRGAEVRKCTHAAKAYRSRCDPVGHRRRDGVGRPARAPRHTCVLDPTASLEIMPASIELWWPQLDEVLRSVLVNNLWSPLSEYALSEIARVGGPSPDSDYYKLESDERYLPGDAVVWIVGTPDSKNLIRPRQEDPRAAYFRRTWPQRR